MRKLFQNAFQCLEKTQHQVVIEDPTCFSVHHFVKKEEETWGFREKMSTTITLDSIGNKKLKSNEEVSICSTANSNVAMKMMKSMGWTEGSGLGAKKQGIVQAIK